MQNLGEIHVILLYDRNGVHGAEGDEVVSGESDNFADHVEELVLGFGRNRDLDAHAHVYKSFTLFLTFLPQIFTTIHVQCMFFKKCTFVVWELHLH